MSVMFKNAGYLIGLIFNNTGYLMRVLCNNAGYLMGIVCYNAGYLMRVPSSQLRLQICDTLRSFYCESAKSSMPAESKTIYKSIYSSTMFIVFDSVMKKLETRFIRLRFIRLGNVYVKP